MSASQRAVGVSDPSGWETYPTQDSQIFERYKDILMLVP